MRKEGKKKKLLNLPSFDAPANKNCCQLCEQKVGRYFLGQQKSIICIHL